MNTHLNLPHMGGNTLSAKLSAQLLAALRNGEFSTCTRLPSENELAAHFSVSRSVIRDVLSSLEREGFIERGRGIGTLVHRDVVNMTNRLDLKYEYNELVRASGSTPGADHIQVTPITANDEISAKLDIARGAPIIQYTKRILASGQPVIYSTDYIPAAAFGSLSYSLLDWTRPVFDLLEEHCGIVVDADMANVSAIVPDETIGSLLQLAPNEAVLHFDEISYYKLSCPILYTKSYFKNFVDFTLIRKKF